MDDLVRFYEECGRTDQSETFEDTNDQITVVELSKVNGSVHFQILTLSGAKKNDWIRNQHHEQNGSILLQLVQIALKKESYSAHRELDISKENYRAVVQKFGLRGLLKYGTSATQVFNQVSENFPDRTCIYSTTHIDDYFSSFHKYDSSVKMIQGICWAGSKILPFLEKAIFHQRILASSPSFLNLCIAASFGPILDSRLCIVSDEMARIERRTGFKAWDLGRYKPAHGDSYALSATASGYATSLAANKRLNRLVASILESCNMKTEEIDVDSSNDATDGDGKGQMAARVELLSQRNYTQQIFIDYLTARLQNQLTALFNLITQTDTRITISLAKDSRMIASASKHDSSSMKALAAVTVVFLPGTFISSLFSIPMFDWQADSMGSILDTRRFWIYWIVTLPLTIATILVWLAWTRMEDSANREQKTKGFWGEDESLEETSSSTA